MARELLTTNLAWRVELVQPSPDLDALLIEAARSKDLAPKALPLLLALRRAAASRPSLLDHRVLYTYWGLKELETLAADLTAGAAPRF